MSSTPSHNPAPQPIRFHPTMERPAPDEAATIEQLVAVLRHIGRAAIDDAGRAYRSVHAKGHGIVHGELHVLDSLPSELAQGLFNHPATYPVILRFSTTPGDIVDDSVSTPRGLAVKLLDVSGDRLPGPASQQTQDFVMQNAPAFSAGTPKVFLQRLSLLARTTSTPQVFKKALSAILRPAERLLEQLSQPSGVVKSLGGHPATNPLGDTYTPWRQFSTALTSRNYPWSPQGASPD